MVDADVGEESAGPRFRSDATKKPGADQQALAWVTHDSSPGYGASHPPRSVGCSLVSAIRAPTRSARAEGLEARGSACVAADRAYALPSGNYVEARERRK